MLLKKSISEWSFYFSTMWCPMSQVSRRIESYKYQCFKISIMSPWLVHFFEQYFYWSEDNTRNKKIIYRYFLKTSTHPFHLIASNLWVLKLSKSQLLVARFSVNQSQVYSDEKWVIRMLNLRLTFLFIPSGGYKYFFKYFR